MTHIDSKRKRYRQIFFMTYPFEYQQLVFMNLDVDLVSEFLFRKKNLK
jgi:hypothetical protein